MDVSTLALINNLHSSHPGTVQASAQILVLKQVMQLQALGAMELLASTVALPPQPALARGGSLGTQLNLYA